MDQKPEKTPFLANLLLRGLTVYQEEHSIAGDIEEVYHGVREDRGRVYAYFWFWIQTWLSLVNYGKFTFTWSFVMLKNYLRIAFRNIVKYKGYSFINITGLAIGMASCLLIYMYVSDELSFDRYHEHKERIYRVPTISSIGATTRYYDTSPQSLAPALAEDIPEIEAFTRIDFQEHFQVRIGAAEFDLGQTIIVDTSFFDIFSYEFTAGDPSVALKLPNSIIITESTAERLFENGEAYGKTVTFIDTFEVCISGVIKDVPENSHFSFNVVRPVTLFEHYFNAGDRVWQNWYYAMLYTFVLLEENSEPAAVNAKIAASVESRFGEQYRQRGTRREYLVEPLLDIHLKSPYRDKLGTKGDITNVYLFSTIAFFILCIASINFVNLSTARSAQRAKEVGLRKALGAAKTTLIKQFMGESLVTTLLSMIISIMIVILAIPLFNDLAEKSFTNNQLLSINVLAGLFVIFITTGILAGSFPAFVLTSFKPVKVLKGTIHTSSGKDVLRKIFVLIQFAISVFMIAGVLVIIKQMDFVQNSDLGYDSDRIVVIRTEGGNAGPLKNSLRQVPGVESVSFSRMTPGQVADKYAFLPEGKSEDEMCRASVLHIDYDFIDTYGLQVISGRDFSQNYPTDSINAIILNEKAVEMLGWEVDPLGKTMRNVAGDNTDYRVVGVIKDFHFRNLKMEISPMVLFLETRFFAKVSLRIDNSNISETLASLESRYREVNPDHKFDYYFLGEELRNKYPEEEKVREVFTWFGGLAILVAALGLFGLASYTIQQRRKEIGIKKVLGASTNGVAVSLIREFSKWVVLSNLAAWPVAYYFMNEWLQNFAYRMDLGAGLFVVSGIIIFIIALIPITYQSYRAASANPVNSLRYE